MLKWLPATLIALAFAGSASLRSRVAPSVEIGLHQLVPPGLAAGTDSIPRAVVLFGLPTVALLLLAMLHEAPVSRLGLAVGRVLWGAGKPRYELFAPTYRLIVLWVVCLVLSVHVALLSEALGWPLRSGTIVGITLGAGLVFVGNAMPRLRQNAVAGIRTARTMSDPVAWARAHRTFGALWLAAGVLTVLTAIVASRYALTAGVVLLLVALVGGFIGSGRDQQQIGG